MLSILDIYKQSVRKVTKGMNMQLKRVAWVLGAILLVALGFVLGSAAAPGQAVGSVTLQVAESPSNQLFTDEEFIFTEVYNRVSPSVVSINIDVQHAGSDVFVPQSLGTGFVIDKQGHIVTNFHVVEGADRISVNLFDGTMTRAKVIGLDSHSDLAVIQVSLPEDRLYPVTFGNSDELIVGQQSLAIGSPFGERWTLTSGIISALDRKIEGLAGFSIGAVVQTDTAINPGNSGGPLLNLQGQVIGVNSQIISESRSNSGVGFAVPSNLVQHIIPDLIANGEVHYSYVGITGDDVNLDIMEEYDLPNNLQGVAVGQVLPGTAAADAGLRGPTNSEIDVITGIDGRPITSMSTLLAYLASNTSPGQQVNLTVLRGDEQVFLPLVLGERPAD
jgi:2-alkenal reductase